MDKISKKGTNSDSQTKHAGNGQLSVLAAPFTFSSKLAPNAVKPFYPVESAKLKIEKIESAELAKFALQKVPSLKDEDQIDKHFTAVPSKYTKKSNFDFQKLRLPNDTLPKFVKKSSMLS